MTLDARAQLVLDRLRQGPADTVQLQHPPIVHAPKQILDLRRAGYNITTQRERNGVACYTLHTLIDSPPAAEVVVRTPVAAADRVPTFGDVAAIREMRRKRR